MRVDTRTPLELRSPLETKVKWGTKDGAEIESGWDRAPFSVEKAEIKTFRQIALSNKSVDFTIMVQLAEQN